MKEMKVTDSFLSLNKEVRGCQNVEPFEDCTTRNYLESLRNNCGCIPFAMGSHSQEC